MDESDSNTDLSNGDVGAAGGAVGVGAGEGEDFVELFAEGGGKGAVPYSVDEDEAAAAVTDGMKLRAGAATQPRARRRETFSRTIFARPPCRTCPVIACASITPTATPIRKQPSTSSNIQPAQSA